MPLGACLPLGAGAQGRICPTFKMRDVIQLTEFAAGLGLPGPGKRDFSGVGAAGQQIHDQNEGGRMGSWLSVMAATARVLLLLSVVVAIPPAKAAQAADPALWGVYAQLLDRQWKSPTTDIVTTFSWLTPGKEIEQSFIGSGAAPRKIELGDKPGELVYWDRSTGLKVRYIGTVQEDGTVLFESDTMIKTAFRLSLTADDLLEYQWVKIKDGQVVKVHKSSVLRYQGLAGPGEKPVATTVASAAGTGPASPVAATRLNTAEVAGPAPVEARNVPLPASAQQDAFGNLLRYAGQRLVGDTDALEISLAGNDALAIQYYTADGRPGRRYLVKKSTAKPGELVLAESPFGSDRMRAQLNADGSLFLEAQDGWLQGWRYSTLFRDTPGGLATTFNSEFKNQLRITLSGMGGMTDQRSLYKPFTEERAIEAAVAARVSAENERIARQNQLREQEQRNANVAAAFGGFAQGVSQGAADHAQAQNQQQDFLDETAIRAQVVADMRQRSLQGEAQEAGQVASAGDGAVEAMPAAGISAESSASKASITVATASPAPKQVAATKSKTWTTHVACMYIGPTRSSEDGSGGVVYFSSATPFEISGSGFSLDPVQENFMADLRARYGDVGPGGALCQTGTAQVAAEAQSNQSTVRPYFKQVDTGIAAR